jgi:hypothetical protein
MGDEVITQKLSEGDLAKLDISEGNNFASHQVGGDDPEGKSSMTINVPVTETVDKNGNKMVKKSEDGLDVNKLFAGKYKTKEEFDKGIVAAFHKKHGDDAEDAYGKLSGDLSGDKNIDPNAKDPDPIEKKVDNDDTRTDAQKAADSAKEVADKEAEAAKADKPLDDRFSDINPHMEKFVTEWTDDGALSTESYGLLEKAGYDRATVDTYLTGIQAQQKEIYDKVGGQDNFGQMAEWASENASKDQIELFNDDMNSGNKAKMHRAVETMRNLFVAKEGGFAPKTRLSPEGGEINTGVAGYTHPDQFKKDQANPLYQTSSEFRAQVKDKLKRGSI